MELCCPHLGNHSLYPLDQSPAEPADGEGDGKLLLSEILAERMVWKLDWALG